MFKSFFGLIGTIFKTLVGGLGMLILLPICAVGAFFLYHAAYDAGAKESASRCNAAALQSQLTAEIAKEHNLETQVAAQQAVVDNLQNQKNKNDSKTHKVIQVVTKYVTTNPVCDLNQQVLDNLNSIRNPN